MNLKKLRKIVMLAIPIFVGLLLLGEKPLALAAPKIGTNPWVKINKDFPGMLQARQENVQSIEFCPDNTCDLFVAATSVSNQALGDFIYLYLYFFSDYNFLSEWRDRSDATFVAQKIIGDSKYKRCKQSDNVKTARCIALNLSRNSRIQLFSVRYDEEVRTVERKNIFISTSR